MPEFNEIISNIFYDKVQNVGALRERPDHKPLMALLDQVKATKSPRLALEVFTYLRNHQLPQANVEALLRLHRQFGDAVLPKMSGSLLNSALFSPQNLRELDAKGRPFIEGVFINLFQRVRDNEPLRQETLALIASDKVKSRGDLYKLIFELHGQQEVRAKLIEEIFTTFVHAIRAIDKDRLLQTPMVQSIRVQADADRLMNFLEGLRPQVREIAMLRILEGSLAHPSQLPKAEYDSEEESDYFSDADLPSQPSSVTASPLEDSPPPSPRAHKNLSSPEHSVGDASREAMSLLKALHQAFGVKEFEGLNAGLLRSPLFQNAKSGDEKILVDYLKAIGKGKHAAIQEMIKGEIPNIESVQRRLHIVKPETETSAAPAPKSSLSFWLNCFKGSSSKTPEQKSTRSGPTPHGEE